MSRVRGWRWLGTNLWIFLTIVIVVGVVLAAAGAAFGQDEDDPWIAGYAWMCLYLPVTWPLYMAVLWYAGRRVRHPRRWAVCLVPLLFALFPFALFTFTAPGVAAAWVAFFIYGATVRLPAGSHAQAGPSRP
jgi:hypothetical protein